MRFSEQDMFTCFRQKSEQVLQCVGKSVACPEGGFEGVSKGNMTSSDFVKGG